MTTPTTAPTKESQRLFIAVPLPDSLKRLIGAWTRDIRTTFPFRKWTDEADLHVTLQFLGDTAPVLIPELKAALASAAGSGRIQPFTYRSGIREPSADPGSQVCFGQESAVNSSSCTAFSA